MAQDQTKISGVGVTAPIRINSDVKNFSVGIIVNVPESVSSVSYSVQVSGDQIGINPTHWNDFEDMTGINSSHNGYIYYPVTHVRMKVTTYEGSGDITFSVIQLT